MVGWCAGSAVTGWWLWTHVSYERWFMLLYWLGWFFAIIWIPVGLVLIMFCLAAVVVPLVTIFVIVPAFVARRASFPPGRSTRRTSPTRVVIC